jgi:plastocyanin domain-containing protein
MRFAAVVLVMMSLAGCEKAKGEKDHAQGTVKADGIRHIPVEASEKGYEPATIHAKPGEKLVLEFTRTTDADCLAQVRMGDGPLVDLPLNKEVDVAVTAPTSGKLSFVCGMDMNTGVIAVN